MNRFGFQWPENLDCGRFPFEGLCVGENRTYDETMEHPSPASVPPFGDKPVDNNEHLGRMGHLCPPAFTVADNYHYRIYVGDEVIPNCGMPCNVSDDAYFRQDHRQFARYMIGITAVVCLVSSLFTVTTFLVDMSRFRYPQRPIIFISGCYSIVAVAYIIGFAIGNKIACSDPPPAVTSPNSPSPPGLESSTAPRLIVTQRTQREGCTIVFMMLYFFSMASCVWWVILTVTWFLSAGLKWGNEAIERNAHYFHLVAWTIPAAKTIILLAFGQVDGDPLAGVCVAGGTDVWWLRVLVLLPLCVYLAIGTCFLLAGFVALCRIRTVMKHDGTRVDKLERLMVRIGIYSVLYMVPASVVIACYVYEQASRANWARAWYTSQNCHTLTCRHDNLAAATPDFTIFMIKYLMALIVGIMSGFWIWSGKTLSSWQRFCCVVVCRRPEPSAI
jgi:hypothetical protein